MQSADPGKSASLWLAALATALLYAAAHPPWSMWPLALVAVAPASAALLDRRRRKGFARAALAGLLFASAATWLLVGQWSFAAAREFFDGSILIALGFTVALPILASAVVAPYAAAFALISRLAGLGATAGVLGSAALWTSAEMARSAIWYGTPWGSFAAALSPVDALLSTSVHTEIPVARMLSIGGPPMVAFAASAIGAAIGLAWCERRDTRARARALVAGAATVAVILAAGHLAELHDPLRNGPVPAAPLRVALVQPGIRAGRARQTEGAADWLTTPFDLSRSAETRGADLIVWPENALAFLLDANVEKQGELRALARERKAALLVGGSRSVRDERGRTIVFNSAFLFPADGGEPEVYDKRVLLPFVGHAPAWTATALESRRRSAQGAGAGLSTFLVKDWRIAPLISLEALYPGEAASRAAEGADLLVNISDDSWFDAGAGPEQHFSLAALLAAETRRPLVRVATTGVSAVVGEQGLVSWTLPLRTAGVALVDVAPPALDSLYVRGGRSGVAGLVLIVALGAALLPSIVGRRVRPAP